MFQYWALWVPKQLAEVHKQTRMDICQKYLDRYGNEQDIILERIITGDETWVHCYELESQGRVWMETSTITLQEKVQNPTIHRKADAYSVLGLTRPSIGTLSWEGHNDKQCAVQWDAYWQAETCNSKQTPRTTVERRCVVARQCPSTYCKKLRKLKFEVMAPPYSSDPAPSDYHLFGSLSNPLRGRRFISDQEVKHAVHAWLAAQPKTFFSEGISKLVQRWTKCVEKPRDYAEKWY